MLFVLSVRVFFKKSATNFIQGFRTLYETLCAKRLLLWPMVIRHFVVVKFFYRGFVGGEGCLLGDAGNRG